jgi:hypothetical protein
MQAEEQNTVGYECKVFLPYGLALYNRSLKWRKLFGSVPIIFKAQKMVLPELPCCLAIRTIVPITEIESIKEKKVSAYLFCLE